MLGLSDFITALGIAFVFEGIAYALVPGRARSALELVSKMPEQMIRNIGLSAALAGLLIVWLARG